MKRPFVVVSLFLVGLMTLTLTPTEAQQSEPAKSSARFHRKGARAIQNHYIVVLDAIRPGAAAMKPSMLRTSRHSSLTGWEP
jgi:hypothetical protein